MPQIIEGKDGVERIMIDGEIYPMKNATSVGIAPEKNFDSESSSLKESNCNSIDIRKVTGISVSNKSNDDALSSFEESNVDIFTHTAQVNDKLLKDVMKALLKSINRKMSRIDTAIYNSADDDIFRDKSGNIAEIQNINIDENGELKMAQIDIPMQSIFAELEPESLASESFSTRTALASFITCKNRAITEGIINAYPTMSIDVTYFDCNDNIIYYDNRDNPIEWRLSTYIRIGIAKKSYDIAAQSSMFEVIKDRIVFNMNPNGSYHKISSDMTESYYQIPIRAVSNNREAALSSTDKGNELSILNKKILDNTNDSIYRFLKKNYQDFFEFMSQYNMFVYIKRVQITTYNHGCDVSFDYIPTVEIRYSPKWFSYITQPILKKKKH